MSGPVPHAARCGVLDVLQNPGQPNGRRLPIHFAVVPASSGTALPDPIVVLMGGPGEDAIGAAAFYAEQPIGYRNPVRSSVPTMFVSGDIDGGTPLWFMEHAATGFAERIEIVAHGQGHTEWSECIAQHYQRFVMSGTAGESRGGSCEAMPRPPFKTD